ncbi:Phosphocarrier protein HPr [Thermotalea metallivorans]|uniref:Phosphocarrier protein HPr n=2 Tax=Thermotalea metallivorans TaxID=520762 RepID=A0A140KZH5_9FIRM|nr:Phosphocarrier protein HPr [Thermotalea metallivorans]
MQKQEIIVKNETGLHARPAAMIVKIASRFQSNIIFAKEDHEANAKSMMGIMALGAAKGERIEIRIEGADEKEAMDAMISLFESNFGE